jgi:mannose-6-phosphate isomerase-like protein (cupin superfamily)
MTEPPFRVAHLSALPRFTNPDGTELDYDFRMVRRSLGVRAFGVNAMQATEAGGVVVPEHSELAEGQRHEELYYVARGAARFTVDGESVDAPEGTFLLVPDPASTRGAVASEAGTIVLGIGGEPGAAFTPSAWESAWSDG